MGKVYKRFKNNVILNIVFAAVVLELISATQFYYTQQLLADELEIRAESELIRLVMFVCELPPAVPVPPSIL